MKSKAIELSLKLFSVVPRGEITESTIEDGLKYGVVIAEDAAYAAPQIFAYYEENKLSGEQLNATFHKSWKVIKKSSREQLFTHQILHYLTTYGTGFTSDFIYIPAEELQLPDAKKIPLKVIRGLAEEEIIARCLGMLSSGIALEEKTIDEVLELLWQFGYKFKSVDGIRNKEALTKIIAKTGVYPSNPVEFLRFLVYLSTESTLLIKSNKSIEEIKEKRLNIVFHLNHYSLEKCATIFNRFKPIWLAFKSNKDNIAAINRISKLSKVYHAPMPVDVLNTITAIEYEEQQIKEALNGVNNFRKIRLLTALNTRINAADTFLYRIRNGTSFAKKEAEIKQKQMIGRRDYYREVFALVYGDLVKSLSLEGQKVKYPEGIDYGVPASEKMFIGNIPTGTKLTARRLVSGVYWENDWGARDIDLSALSIGGKVGWNSAYKAEGLLYSGDVTDADSGATELLYSNEKLSHPALSSVNIFSGSVGCKFKVVVGVASKVKKNYMFDPNELLLEVETEMKSRQQILGLFLPEEDGTSFVLINAGFGNISVSSSSIHSENAKVALYSQYANPMLLKQLLIDAGAVLVSEDECDIDMMPQRLQKDSLIQLLRGETS